MYICLLVDTGLHLHSICRATVAVEVCVALVYRDYDVGGGAGFVGGRGCDAEEDFAGGEAADGTGLGYGLPGLTIVGAVLHRRGDDISYDTAVGRHQRGGSIGGDASVANWRPRG